MFKKVFKIQKPVKLPHKPMEALQKYSKVKKYFFSVSNLNQ